MGLLSGLGSARLKSILANRLDPAIIHLAQRLLWVDTEGARKLHPSHETLTQQSRSPVPGVEGLRGLA